MNFDLGPPAKLGGHPEECPQVNAGVPRGDEERYAGLGDDVDDLKRAEGFVHHHDCLEVQSDPGSAPIRNWAEVR
jgi:hypothetical protein